MVDTTEVISLVFLLVAFVFMLVAIKKVPNWKFFAFAFFFPLLTGITTVAEDFFLNDLMNFIEHVSWMVGAIVFCWAIYKFTQTTKGKEK